MASIPQDVSANSRTQRKAAIKRAARRARLELRTLDAEARAGLTEVYRRARDDIKTAILHVAQPAGNVRLEVLQDLLRQVEGRITALGAGRDAALATHQAAAAKIGVSPFAEDVASLGTSLSKVSDDAVQFVRRFVAADGLQLSDRLWRLDMHAREIIGQEIQTRVIQGHSASKAAEEFLLGGQQAPAFLVEKIGQAQAEKIANVAGAKLLGGKGSPHANALRVFRTEINRAHGEAFRAAAFEHPDVVGTRFLLSPNHPRPDICDMHARVNRYGLGPGVYPRGRSPWPAHPNTLSFEEPVFRDEVTDEDRAGKETRIEWLQQQPPGVRVGVLGGTRKAQAFAHGLIAESEIATPWRVLRPRLEKKGFSFTHSPELASEFEDAARNQAQIIAEAAAFEAAKAELREQAAAAAERAKEAAAQRAAQIEIDAIEATGTGFAAKALTKLKKSGEIDADTPPAQALEKVQAEAAALEQKKKTQSGLSKYKSAIVAGKAPPPAGVTAVESLTDAERAEFLAGVEAAVKKKKKQFQSGKSKYKQAVLQGKDPPPAAVAAFDSMTAAEQKAFLEEIEAAKIKQAAEALQAGELRFADFERVGPQGGSNPGGLFRHQVTGEQWYIKTPASEDIARNEVLAGALYRAVGVEVPELRLLEVDGKPGVASRIVEGLGQDAAALRAARVAGVHEGFAVDAWLANWDVVGLEFDNLLVKGGRALRVDTGGALRYRAQGGLKGARWGPVVEELDTLRNPQTNPQAASVFGSITREQLEASVARVLAVDDDEIRRLVEGLGPRDAAARRELVETLLARQQDLGRRFPALARQRPAPAPADAGARITEEELGFIREARLNGYAVNTDKGDVEDQSVLVWHELDESGAPVTVAVLKVREQAKVAIGRLVKESGGDSATFDDRGAHAKVLEAVKGVGMQASKSDVLRDKDIARIREARTVFDAAVAEIQRRDGAPVARGFRAHFEPWIQALEASLERHTARGGPAFWSAPGGRLLEQFVAPVVDTGQVPRVRFERVSGVWRKKKISRGHAQLTAEHNYTTGHTWQATLANGVTVRYWPDTGDVPFALRNRLELESPGNAASDGARLFEALDELGVDSSRATSIDTEELYLRRVAYHLRDGFRDFEAAVNGVQDQSERVAAMQAWVSQHLGSDITQSPLYRPEGAREAFNQGRRHQVRPDLFGPRWERFTAGYVLHHRITQSRGIAAALDRVLESGGVMAPTTEKLRRGLTIGGMSPASDLGTGGASYFFTRVQTRATAQGHEGLNWKADHLARLDAISYSSDQFGRVTSPDFVLGHRRTGIDEWRATARSGSNETIFKDGLSIFDALDSIRVRASDLDKVMKVLEKHKIREWPDGRPLSEVVKVVGRD